MTFAAPGRRRSRGAIDAGAAGARGEVVARARARWSSVGRPDARASRWSCGARTARRSAEGRLGRIWVRGPSLLHGLPGRSRPPPPGRSATAGSTPGTWASCVGGELHVHGRAKDLVIVRGANHAPEEFEAALAGLEGLRPGCAVALGFAPDGGTGRRCSCWPSGSGAARGRRTGRSRRRCATRCWTRTGVAPPHGAPPRARHAAAHLLRASSARGEALRRFQAGTLLAAAEGRPPLAGAGRPAPGWPAARARRRARSVTLRDVMVVGGGPAGLAGGGGGAVRGLDALVLERRALPGRQGLRGGAPPRRACGPSRRSGAVRQPRLRTPGPRCAAIRWIHEAGTAAEVRLPAPGRASASGARRSRRRSPRGRARPAPRCASGPRSSRTGATPTERGRRWPAARSFAGASWSPPTASPRRSGSEKGSDPPRAPRRFGLRRHLALVPWTDAVEVHFSRGVEAYVTPVGPRRVGVAFLFEEGTAPDFESAPGPLPGAGRPARPGAFRLGARRGGPARAGCLRPRAGPAGPRRRRRRVRGRHHR